MTLPRLTGRIELALADPEFMAFARGLSVRVAFSVEGARIDLLVADGTPSVEAGATGRADIAVTADAPAWEAILSPRPPRGASSFTAWQLANPAVSLEGDPLRIAQARPALERLVEILRTAEELAAPSARRDVRQIRGHYFPARAAGTGADLYVEEAGSGTPVLCLHTAGADSRQYGGLLADADLASRFRLVAFDMPFHGRTMPPPDWDGGAYRLDTATYLAWVVAALEQVVGEPAILVGCSMGAAIALVAAAERPDLLRGVVALEPPLRSPGRRNPYLAHAAVSGGAHNAAYVRGLMSPLGPVGHRRRAAWIYAQGGPGVYTGDLAFYSEEFDGHVTGPQIDTGRVPVTLMTGEYDYSATVADGEALSGLISGSRFVPMPGLGHFPMSEHPDLFRTHVVPELDRMVELAR
jgi:pimeloyl-ACP methyl ester carboxylesterase